MKRLTIKALLAQFLLLGGLGLLWAQQDTGRTQTQPLHNTTVNQRDRNPSESTADRQKENPTDRQLAQQIRKALVKDKSLSTYAHNVKVIAQNGMSVAGEIGRGKAGGRNQSRSDRRSCKVTSEIQIASK